jgi:chemotaxis protein MotB
MSAQHDKPTVIIVRRKKHGDHGHHGGAWKIAYADFVTAMMAFFLVMWLINAANEKTRAQVASYFNPVKLTDTSTAKKGLNNIVDRNPVPGKEKAQPPTSAEPTKEKSDAEKTETKKADPDKAGHYSEEQLFRNPYGILGLLSGQAITQMSGHAGKGFAIAETSNNSGKAVQPNRDPFDPYAWRALTESQLPTAVGADSTSAGADPVAKPPVLKTVSHANAAVEKQTNVSSELLLHEKAVLESHEKAADKTEVTTPENKLPPAQAGVGDPKEAISIRNHIIDLLKDFPSEQLPNFEVKQTSEGILISLTDSLSFDMFAVGSSQPQPSLVQMMEKISGAIENYNGEIVIRGHTDSRPFRGGGNDNWRLSASRAQMAFYMLVRAGLDEQKVERIEGYADHDPKFPEDPESASNRRIEILLKAKKQ